MKEIYEYIKRDKAYKHALTLLSWDLETEAPKLAVDNLSDTMSTLAELQYDNLVNTKFKTLLYSLDEEKLSEIDKKVVIKLKKDIFEKMSKIPKDEFSKYSALLTKAQAAWEEAKNKGDYEIFKPYLKELIEINKRFINYRGYSNCPYDVLVDDYETGLNVEILEKFFEKIFSTFN